MAIVATAITILLLGSLVYCILTIAAARHYLARHLNDRANEESAFTSISILKPLSGIDEGLEENLRSFFAQDYPDFEILLAVHSPDDPAIQVIERVRKQFPQIPSRLIITEEPPYPNHKVYSLARAAAEAHNDLLLMSDSDVRVSPQLLRCIAKEFQDSRVGLVTCPYRAVPGLSFWTTLEAIGMNTEFLSGVLVARMLNGMDFALGCTLAIRRKALEQIGGFDLLKDYLAEDFVMGKKVSESGWRVLLSCAIIEHRIGSQNLSRSVKHRLRWARSTRRSRPLGYIGQVFTNPLPLAVLLCVVWPPGWWLAILTVMFRAAAAWATAGWVLHDPLVCARWWLVPVQDLLSFVVWIGGFFGNTILWRGKKYYLFRDGKFELRR